MRKTSLFVGGAFVLIVLAGVPSAAAPGQSPGTEALLQNFTYRNLGPFRMGARLSDIAVPDVPAKAHASTFYIATWTGGLWKTTNSGTTYEPVFDGQNKLTIGDVTLAPSNPNIVWVGTGDAFCSRSSYAGDGVYKSTDAGKTWTNMGLRDSHHIARIVVHPRNRDVVYVAAMGHLFSENRERGVFKTTDGGRTWTPSLFLDDRVGVIDLVMNPRYPEVLYAAAYDKQRLPWMYVNGGPKSGIYRTSDGGKTWARLGGGLPVGRIGRIGLDLYPKNPEIVYAVVENANTRPPTKAETEQDRARNLPSRERMIGGEVYRTGDGGTTWAKMNSAEDNVSSKGPYYFSQIRVDPNNDRNLFITGVSLANSTDGGRTWSDIDWPPKRLFAKMFGDVRTLWIDSQDSDRMILGSDGGVFVSYDGGRTCDHHANLPLGENYAVGVDMEDPYNIYAGLQDHELWKGPSTSPDSRGVSLLDWKAVGNGDGMFAQVDPDDIRWLYTTMQYGGHFRVDQKLGIRTSIAPVRESGKPPYRFIWCTPLHLSPHNSRILYTGGQVLLRSLDRGDHWQEISPDLSTNDTAKIVPSSEGGLPGGIPFFAISSISESPVTPGVIWVGTSDGKVQLTRNDGAAWIDLTPNIAAAGGREDCYVSRVVASRHKAGTAYVAKNGFRNDDFRPFIYKTEDDGATWMSLAAGLPNEPVNVVFEDAKNPQLLFLGNDTGVFVSLNGGKLWAKMNNNMPNVPVHDLVVHPRESDLVVGSYGRGIFVTNIAPLQEISDPVLAEDVHLFAIKPTAQRVTWAFGANDYLFGDKHIVTPNEANGVAIRYFLKNKSSGPVRITVRDAYGKELAALDGPTAAGIQTVLWDMRTGGSRRDGPGAGGRSRDILGQWVPPGEYTVALETGGQKLTQKASITKTTGWSLGPFPQVIR
ncbi:MAG: hypothetical protein Q8O91_11530 [Candidatus Aminicenantes bacterium]|nr:hypothetical protein [Candidatus Aminicenantes bacterium]